MSDTKIVRRACGCDVEVPTDFPNGGMFGWCRACLEDHLVRDAATAITALRQAGVNVDDSIEEAAVQYVAGMLALVK